MVKSNKGYRQAGGPGETSIPVDPDDLEVNPLLTGTGGNHNELSLDIYWRPAMRVFVDLRDISSPNGCDAGGIAAIHRLGAMIVFARVDRQ